MCFLSDIDECARNMHNCHTDATCQNLIGLFNCFCKVGLEGNGTHCKDITECSSNIHNCSQVATCYEMYASYSCVCHTGYTGDGFSCYGNKVIPVKFISQLFGTFILPGFYLDVNECSLGGKNTEGETTSFLCALNVLNFLLFLISKESVREVLDRVFFAKKMIKFHILLY
ncbi:protein kinase C-binding protein NELL2-like isoform X1 [Hydractinia symbiolongicarpus]|uniref:protein kinase C-binding protein NELL2-like isoform X1 n=1 Tax=Hydractinia symbiolongicarpus TaxID=13093 RepID=UPI00254B8139|nr:protein kinase C-binding protein NELL2-like isoform X1 [Hydractinia symbiolongicarpus]